MNRYSETPTMELSDARNSLARCIARDVVDGVKPASDMLVSFALMEGELEQRLRA